jgi:hypothetical protein
MDKNVVFTQRTSREYGLVLQNELNKFQAYGKVRGYSPLPMEREQWSGDTVGEMMDTLNKWKGHQHLSGRWNESLEMSVCVTVRAILRLDINKGKALLRGIITSLDDS